MSDGIFCPMNSPMVLTFILNLVVVVILLVATIVAGKQAKRTAHYRLVAGLLVGLVVAIWQAETLGRGWEFPEDRTNIHLGFAFSALGTLPLVAWTGWRLAKGHTRAHHRWAVIGFVGLTLAAIGTACWMVAGGHPLEQ